MKRKTLLLVMFLFAACGTDTEDAQAPEETTVATTTPSANGLACTDNAPSAPEPEGKPGTTKPDVTIPDGAPPCTLVTHDIHVGDGDEAENGASVVAHYVGVSWSTGEQFDASWDSGEPVPFSLNQVIQGWQDGIPGMKEGGRRRLIIPPDLAYGANPDPRSGIAPNETLVFVVDLIEVE